MFYCDLHRQTATNLSGTQSAQNMAKSVRTWTSYHCPQEGKENFEKEKKDKQVKLNAFNKFRTLNVNESSDNNDKQGAHVSINVDDSSNSNSK
eukprot:6207084-Ditylum_brightwellii.AAC.2